MFRTSDILWVGLMIGLVAFTYKVKYDAQKNHARIRQIERQIEAEQDTINLLKAEWALMSAPDRIARLSGRYRTTLALEVIPARQIVTLDDVPQRLPGEIDMLMAEFDPMSEDTILGDSFDLLITGGIVP